MELAAAELSREIAQERSEGEGEYHDSGEAGTGEQNAFPTLLREPETRVLRICEGCGLEFRPRRRHQKFHSPQCRKERWERRHRPALSALDPDTPLLREYLKAHGAALCGFCQRLTKVNVDRGGEQRAVCKCGARWFRRRRRNGELERGWKKGKRERLWG